MPLNNINATIINNSALAATVTSPTIGISQQASVAIQSVYSGTFNGSIQYNVSNDGVNWTAKGSAIAVSSAGSTMTEWANAGFCFVQAVYTRTSGTVNLLITLSAKG